MADLAVHTQTHGETLALDAPAATSRAETLATALYRWLRAFGIDPLATRRALREIPGYRRDLKSFKKLSGSKDIALRPQLHDRTEQAGGASGHYFWQDLLVAKRVFRNKPVRHVDVGSRLDGLVAHLLAFRDVDVVDIRRLDSEVEGLTFHCDDATSLATFADKSVDSISSLHAIEHFGLGRYGDPVDPLGHLKGLHALQRVLSPGGNLWISFPIGRQATHFNSQRIISPEMAGTVLDQLVLQEFVAIPPDGKPVFDRSPEEFNKTSGWCGLYEFRRPLTETYAE